MENGKDIQGLRDLRIAYKSHGNINIRPEDSVSNIGSERSSKRSVVSRASSRLSNRSAASAKVKAAARKAILEAEAAALQRLNALQEEELRLQQRMRQLELQTNIAKAEAEEKAYAEAELAEESAHRETEPLELRDFFIIDHTGEHSEALLDPPPPLAISSIDVTPRDAAERSTEDQIKRSTTTKLKQSYVPQDETPQASTQGINPLAAEWNNEFNPMTPNNASGDVFGKMLDVQERQSRAFQQLFQQQQANIMALTLPQPDLPVFDGDPTRYCDFIRAFENLIERKTSSSSARLYYLVQYTSGQVQELMRSCLSMKEDQGYREARKLLLERYGQPYKIATAFVDRIANTPPIKADDGPGLQRFSILLTSCSNTLKEIGYISKLENPDGLRKIVDRLPFSLKLKWRETVDTVMQRENREVTVKDITDFIVARARVANHPIFGRITNDSKQTGFSKTGKQQPRAKSYATQSNLLQPYRANGVSKDVKCPSCNSNHWLSQCAAFKKMSVDDRYKLIREKNLCLNCLVPGHFV